MNATSAAIPGGYGELFINRAEHYAWPIEHEIHICVGRVRGERETRKGDLKAQKRLEASIAKRYFGA